MNWNDMRFLIMVAALVPLGYYLFAIIAALRFFRERPDVAPEFAPPVSILKPVRGLDRETYENYSSFCRLDYPDYEILFNVADEHDAAIPVIQKIIQDFPERSIRLLIGAEQLGTSNKVNKLSRMVEEARYDVLVVSDSDIRVSPDYLRSVVAPFHDPKVGAVTCLYRGLAGTTLGSELEALGNSSDFDPGVLAAWQLGEVSFTLGATMATTRRHLAEIGGFEGLVDHFTDDHELGQRISAAGYRIKFSRVPVDTVYPSLSMAESFRHQVRWALTIRHSSPGGHVGLIFTQGLFWALLASAVARSLPVAAAYLAGYVVLRTAMAWTVGVWGLKDPLLRRRMWLLPVRDAFAFVVLLQSFLTRRIEWRGVEYYIRGKELVPVEPRPARG
ncbi:MAG: bacteriohopanetetrol glucosamine biosynthesis glycosyltransferase HpnI [Candidatus Acidiferrales bacterium]